MRKLILYFLMQLVTKIYFDSNQGHSPSPPEELEAEVHKEEIPVSKSCYLMCILGKFIFYP